jgi:hypothetical protein
MAMKVFFMQLQLAVVHPKSFTNDINIFCQITQQKKFVVNLEKKIMTRLYDLLQNVPWQWKGEVQNDIVSHDDLESAPAGSCEF